MQCDNAGNIWFGADEGLGYYDGKSFRNFTESVGINISHVYSMAADSTGNLWLGMRSGVLKYDGKEFSELRNGDLPFSNVRSVLAGKNGKIWIGSFQLYSYEPANSTKAIKKYPTGFVQNIFQDHQGCLWLSVGENGGKLMSLVRYNGKKFMKIIESAQVFGLAEDRSGRIWAGTESGAKTILEKEAPVIADE
jgi:ligand-binding sensor domain-containing protein